MAAPAATGARGAALFPALFVLLWSTGFIAAKYGLPYAPPFSFLFYRFALVSVLMAALAFVTGARRPRSLREWRDLALVALGVHALYLGGVFVALDGGMAAGTSAMLVGMQPILTVVLAHYWLGEPVRIRQWAGLVLGLAGVWCVVRLKVDFGGALSGLVASAIALVGISVGTLYQKRHCAHVDLISGAAVQYAVCAAVFAPLAWLVDARPVQWVPSFVFALSWSVLVLSVGAITLLYWLLRHGAAANVARLFYLVPPVTAVMAWLLFGETLDALAIAGMALICLGVALARRPA
ncbi:MAG: DMT family transporter [Betaproteobacteria bacterium]|nr:DMT family transporter [Betaproteobacteria bacterium]